MSAITTLAPLLPVVVDAGRLALEYFSAEDQGATRKRDGSVVTKADKAVEALLEAALADLFPRAGLLAEEGARRASEPGAGTFVVDPIDGTEAFTCRAPAWCIAVGLLDTNLVPIAGIVHAPAWGATWFADVDPESPALWNGQPMDPVAAEPARELTHDDTLLVDSKAHRTHRLRGYPGKARSYGSTALHASLVASQTGFSAAQLSSAMAWDVAAPHAVCRRVGVAMHLHRDSAPDDAARGIVGPELAYGPLMSGRATEQPVLVGPPHLLASLAGALSSAD